MVSDLLFPGDRVQSSAAPSKRSLGSVLAVKAQKVEVAWDDGQQSWVSAGNLAPVLFRPDVIFRHDWESLPENYRGMISREGISEGYESIEKCSGATSVTPVVVREQQLTFDLGCNRFSALDCKAITPNLFVFLTHNPNASKSGDWVLIHAKLLGDRGGIIDASERQFFQTWGAASRTFEAYQTLFDQNISSFLKEVTPRIQEKGLNIQLTETGFGLVFQGKLLRWFRFGKEASLESFIERYSPMVCS